jgi:tight adherence protein B
MKRVDRVDRRTVGLGLVGVAGGAALAGAAGALAAGMVCAALVHVGAGAREVRRDTARAQAWQRSLAAVASALRSGATMPDALFAAVPSGGRPSGGRRSGDRHSGSGSALFAESARYARLGADPAQLLREVPHRRAAHLAVCLATSSRLGIPSASVVTGLAEAEGAYLRQSGEVDAALATARATVRLLAFLPALGLLAACAVDASGARTMFATPLGRGCLLVAAILESLGLVWVRRVEVRARR